MSQIHHIMVSNQHEHPVLQMIKKDGIALGWTHQHILGNNSMQIGPPDSFGLKLILVKHFLNSLPETDIVLFTDAHDVRVTATPEQVLKTFQSFQTRVLLSSERNCWPNEKAREQYLTYHPSEILYKYVNSGGYIGYVKDLKTLLHDEDLAITNRTDDQDIFTFLYLKYQHYPEFIKLDTECKLFQCLYLAHEDVDIEKRQNIKTKTYPLIWHGNAGGKEGDPLFVKHVCQWVLPSVIHQLSTYTEQQLLQLLYEVCTSDKLLEKNTISYIEKYYSKHSILQYLLGVYYRKQKDWYKALFHLKQSIRQSLSFVGPVFEITDIFQKILQDAPLEKYLLPLFNKETTDNPNTPLKFSLANQLRICSLLGPNYERKQENAKAFDMYHTMYEYLDRLDDSTYSAMANDQKYMCAECWKNISFGLGRTASDIEKKKFYLREAVKDFKEYLKENISTSLQQKTLEDINLQVYISLQSLSPSTGVTSPVSPPFPS